MNWKQRAYILNPERPPLVKLVAALPPLPLDLKAAPRNPWFLAEAQMRQSLETRLEALRD